MLYFCYIILYFCYIISYFILFTADYMCSHIYQDFIITTHYYIVFYHLIIHNFS